jgi:PadR family transcriptional regulator
MYRQSKYAGDMVAMQQPTYFVLAALLDGPLHGYGILGRASELSEGRVNLAVGTLYGALNRLAGAGLVETDREEVVDGRRRQYYRLTPDGRRRLNEEAVAMERAALVVRGRLQLGEIAP